MRPGQRQQEQHSELDLYIHVVYRVVWDQVQLWKVWQIYRQLHRQRSEPNVIAMA